MTDLTNPIFTDADKARKHLENLYWPLGPVCRHCGNADPKRITKLAGKSTRPGVYWCNECNKPFSVTVGTVMEDSKIALNKWVLAFHLMASSKKGITRPSTAPDAWRHIQDRMVSLPSHPRSQGRHRPPSGSPLGGEGKVVEADETYVGGKAKNRAHSEPIAQESRCFAHRTRWSRPFVPCRQRDRQNRPIAHRDEREPQEHTNERRGELLFPRLVAEFAAHHAVDHTRKEYAYADLPTGHTVSINVSENFYSILQARDHRNLPPVQRGAFASLSRRVRFPI